MELQIPPPSGGGPGPVGPPGPPSISYAYKSYLPYLIATTILPLIGLLYISIRTILLSRKGEVVFRPDSTLYAVYLVGGFANIAFGAAVLYKLVKDYVYGSLPMWRWINSLDDLVVYKGIANFVSKYYFIAGLVIGFSLLLIILGKTYEYWYVDFLLYVGNIGLFLYLTPRPFENFRFTSRFLKTHNVTVSQPYDLVKSDFNNNLYLGIVIGIIISIIIFIYYNKKTIKTR